MAPTRHETRHPKGVNRAVIGIVEKMTGPAFVLHAGSSGRSSVSLGARVLEGDRFMTTQARLHVRYKDGTYVELGEESSWEAERIRFKAPNAIPVNKPADELDESVFRFLYGIARVTAPDVHSQEVFSVKTANALLRVSGPADFYLVQLPSDRDLTLRVARGSVDLMNVVTNEKMTVPEGSAAYLRVSGAVTSAGPFTAEQLAFLKSRTRI